MSRAREAGDDARVAELERQYEQMDRHIDYRDREIEDLTPDEEESDLVAQSGVARPGPEPGGAAPRGATSARAAAGEPSPGLAGPDSLSDIRVGEHVDLRLTDAMTDSVEHGHIVRLRELAMARMQSSGPNRPVKVVPLHYDPATSVRGNFTLAKNVVGRTPEELAREFGVTEFASGVRIFRLDPTVLRANPSLLQLKGVHADACWSIASAVDTREPSEVAQR